MNSIPSRNNLKHFSQFHKWKENFSFHPDFLSFSWFYKEYLYFSWGKKFTHENKKKSFKMFHTFHATFFYSWNFLRPKIFSPEKCVTHEREICFSPEKFSFHSISYDEFFNREKNYFLQFFFFFLKSPELFFSFFLLVSYPNIFLSLWKRNPFSNTIYFPPGRKRLLVFTRDFFHFPEKKKNSQNISLDTWKGRFMFVLNFVFFLLEFFCSSISHPNIFLVSQNERKNLGFFFFLFQTFLFSAWKKKIMKTKYLFFIHLTNENLFPLDHFYFHSVSFMIFLFR